MQDSFVRHCAYCRVPLSPAFDGRVCDKQRCQSSLQAANELNKRKNDYIEFWAKHPIPSDENYCTYLTQIGLEKEYLAYAAKFNNGWSRRAWFQLHVAQVHDWPQERFALGQPEEVK